MPKNILIFFGLLIKHNEINNGINDEGDGEKVTPGK